MSVRGGRSRDHLDTVDERGTEAARRQRHDGRAEYEPENGGGQDEQRGAPARPTPEEQMERDEDYELVNEGCEAAEDGHIEYGHIIGA
jgi:hypothetical protein